MHPRRSSSRRTFLGNSRNADGPRRVTCESASLNFAVRSCEGCEGGTADSKDTSIVSETNNLDMFLSIAKPHAHNHETARNGVVNMHLKANSGDKVLPRGDILRSCVLRVVQFCCWPTDW